MVQVVLSSLVNVNPETAHPIWISVASLVTRTPPTSPVPAGSALFSQLSPKSQIRSESKPTGGYGGPPAPKRAKVEDVLSLPRPVVRVATTASVLEVCRFWKAGHCREGDACLFPHTGDQDKRAEMCKFFKSGYCKKGDSCIYAHDKKQVCCKNLLEHGECVYGLSCLFSHDKEMMQRERAIQVSQRVESSENREERAANSAALPFSLAAQSAVPTLLPFLLAATETSPGALQSRSSFTQPPNDRHAADSFPSAPLSAYPPPTTAAEELSNFL